MNKNKNLAFTLAEVLIVIGIIGVVAALTLPNLNHATGDKEKVTKVKKIYSTLSEAFDRATAIYGPIDTWRLDELEWSKSNEVVGKRISEFLKVSKVCGFEDGCFSNSTILWSDGAETEFSGTGYTDDFYKVLLTDNTSLSFVNRGSHIHMRVDIDGPQKGKNKLGDDIFDFVYCFGPNHQPTTEVPFNMLYAGKSDFNEDGYFNFDNYAAAWVIEFGNLDYLRCPDELVNGKTSCE